MSRISLLVVAVAVAAGVVGCAQCDTCDDFPTPCIGPNCGQPPGILDLVGQQGSPVMGPSVPSAPSGYDSAGPGPDAPEATPMPTPTTPEVDPKPGA